MFLNACNILIPKIGEIDSPPCIKLRHWLGRRSSPLDHGSTQNLKSENSVEFATRKNI